MGSRRVGGEVGGRRWGSVPACPLPGLPSPDCDLHCKPTRGSYRISLKKFCRKDYGRQPSGLPPPPSHHALPTFPLDTLTLAGPIPQVPHCHWPCPVSQPLGDLSAPSPAVSSLCGLPLQWLFCFPLSPPSWPLSPGSPLSSLPLPSLTPPPLVLPAAVQVAVGARGEARGLWTRFPVAVLAVFRSGEERARRGSSALWVPARDAACGCPHLLPGRRYLLLGGGPGAAVGDPGGRGPGLIAARGSLVLPWRDAWTRRLRRLQRRERRGRCGAA